MKGIRKETSVTSVLFSLLGEGHECRGFLLSMIFCAGQDAAAP